MGDYVGIISARQLDWYVNCGAVIIDLREPSSYKKTHIRNSINIPYESINYRDFMQYKGQQIILYCDRGSASMIVSRELIKRGYNAKSVIGGIEMYRGKELQKY